PRRLRQFLPERARRLLRPRQPDDRPLGPQPRRGQLPDRGDGAAGRERLRRPRAAHLLLLRQHARPAALRPPRLPAVRAGGAPAWRTAGGPASAGQAPAKLTTGTARRIMTRPLFRRRSCPTGGYSPCPCSPAP